MEQYFVKFRQKIINTCSAIKYSGYQSLEKLSQLTGYSKSSTHRQVNTINSRTHIIGADFFETEEGSAFLKMLVVATLLVFGLQANVGAGRQTSTIF